jgi:SAM-dependent methyltransferase
MGVFYDWQWPDLGLNKPNDWICWPAAFGLVFLGPIFGTAMVDALAGVTDCFGAWLFGLRGFVMAADQETIAVYDTKIQDYAALKPDPQQDKAMRDFSAQLPPGARVLDYGCGPGAFARAFADQGFEVEAFDASKEMVALTQADPRIKAWQARFEEFQALHHYDGVWASFSLLHAPRDRMPDLLMAIQHALKPKGCLTLALKLGSGSRRDSLGRLYTYYSLPELRGLLTEAKFDWLNHIEGKSIGLDGTQSDWAIVHTRVFDD